MRAMKAMKELPNLWEMLFYNSLIAMTKSAVLKMIGRTFRSRTDDDEKF